MPEVAQVEADAGRGKSLPAWVNLVEVARWLNVPPWELAKQHFKWYEWSVTLIEAEAESRRRNRGE